MRYKKSKVNEAFLHAFADLLLIRPLFHPHLIEIDLLFDPIMQGQCYLITQGQVIHVVSDSADASGVSDNKSSNDTDYHAVQSVPTNRCKSGQDSQTAFVLWGFCLYVHAKQFTDVSQRFGVHAEQHMYHNCVRAMALVL